MADSTSSSTDPKDDPDTIHHPPGVAENEKSGSDSGQGTTPATEEKSKTPTPAATPAPITHPGG